MVNELYKGDYVHGKRTKKPTYYENVVEPIVSKQKWEDCQYQKQRNARHYERTATYLFTNKLKCSKCGRFLGGCATTKPNKKKYYYYKCSHCKTYFNESDIEETFLGLMIEIVKQDELINDYYTPFIKSKLDNKQIDYEKQIKELDKQLDRIKTAYIKGILKIDDFEKEINQIEFQKDNLNKKWQEQKQYENLSFTVDDLLILQDKQEIDNFVKPEILLTNIAKWLNLSREERQRLIATYIDYLELEKKDKKIEIIKGNFRESYLKEMRYNHNNYDIPYNCNIFEDEYGYRLNINHEVKSKESARKYFDKLCSTLGSEYKLNYYEIDSDDDLIDVSFKPKSELEKIIRLIALENENKFKNEKLRFGVITIDLSDVKDKNGNSLYKDFFEKIRKVFKDELCDI